MATEELPQLTVRGLIDRLQALLSEGCSPDALVCTEGCDCYGEATSADLDSDGSVMIARRR